MGFGKKKKEKKETAEELRAKLQELEGTPEGEPGAGEEDLDVLPEPPKLKKKAKETKTEIEPKGEFSLNENEMTLAVNALANSEEFKLYQQMVIGEQAAKIIATYNKVVGGKETDEVPEDTEEELPEPV